MAPRSSFLIWILAAFIVVSYTYARELDPSDLNHTIPVEFQKNQTNTKLNQFEEPSIDISNLNSNLDKNLNVPSNHIHSSHTGGKTRAIAPNKKPIHWIYKVKSTVTSAFTESLNVISNSIANLTASSSKEIHGQMGGLWYRYWAINEESDIPVNKKIIGRAMKEAMKKLAGNWSRKVYCVTMNDGPDWLGTLLLGSNSRAMAAKCEGKFQGSYDDATGDMQWKYGGLYGLFYT